MGQLKTFEISLNFNQNIFHPGQYVNGKCIIETNSEITCKFLKIKMKGISKVDWTESFYNNSNEFNRFDERRETAHHRDKVRYFNYKQILQEKSNLIDLRDYFKND